MSRKREQRKLRVEGLEARQMLHGGAVGPAPADIAERLFDRLNTNGDDVVLVSDEGGDEISDRTWNKVSKADVEGSEAGVTVGELETYVEQKLAERIRNIKRRHRLTHLRATKMRAGDHDVTSLVERVFANKDADGSGTLDAEELGNRWEKLADIAGEDGVIDSAELEASINARRAEQQAKREAKREAWKAQREAKREEWKAKREAKREERQADNDARDEDEREERRAKRKAFIQAKHEELKAKMKAKREEWKDRREERQADNDAGAEDGGEDNERGRHRGRFARGPMRR